LNERLSLYSEFIHGSDDELDALARRSTGAQHKNAGLAVQLAPINCPCCNQYVPVPSIEIVVDRYKIAPQEARVLSAVWRGKGMPVSTERIFGAMYIDDPNGGPDVRRMYSAFKWALCNLRKRLDGSGISIENAGYRRGYRLILGAK